MRFLFSELFWSVVFLKFGALLERWTRIPRTIRANLLVFILIALLFADAIDVIMYACIIGGIHFPFLLEMVRDIFTHRGLYNRTVRRLEIDRENQSKTHIQRSFNSWVAHLENRE